MTPDGFEARTSISFNKADALLADAIGSRAGDLARRTGGRRRIGPDRLGRLGWLCRRCLGRRRPHRLGRLCRLLRTSRRWRWPSGLRPARLLSASCWPLRGTHRDPRRSGPWRRCRRGGRGSRRLWRGDFRFGLRFRLGFFCFSCRSWSGRCCGGCIRLFRRRLVALDQFRRYASGRARHSLRENWRTVASQLFFAVEHIRIENLGGIELTALRAAGNHQRERQHRSGAI
jgi:hypothetical protein